VGERGDGERQHAVEVAVDRHVAHAAGVGQDAEGDAAGAGQDGQEQEDPVAPAAPIAAGPSRRPW
jgi:hypothetical protein